MMNADVAMYDAKEAGRGRFSVHDPSDERAGRLTDTVTWAEAIRDALADDGFVLYQQPILDLRTDEIARHELLLRMVGDDGEHVAPATFLYIAERFGLVQEIDAWVVRRGDRADRRAGAARAAPGSSRSTCSGLSLTSPEVIATIEHELAETGIDPACLTFEITETAAIVNIQKARAFAERIAELGCGFALDDFGAGFGSFYYLKHLPFDVLKIDGEFVRNLTRLRQGPGRRQVARADRDRARQADRRRVRRGRRDARARAPLRRRLRAGLPHRRPPARVRVARAHGARLMTALASVEAVPALDEGRSRGPARRRQRGQAPGGPGDALAAGL